MGFLVPLYLLGALAVALPVYLHLRRKPPKDTVEFGSIMFLRPTEFPPVKRSRRLENLPLLLLRCLALLLLAGLFARPFLGGGEEELGEAGRRTVVLLDTSASMKRDGLWDAARDEVSGLLDEAGPGDPVALLAFDGTPRTLVGFDDRDPALRGRTRELLDQSLEDLEPGWRGTNLGSALLAAAELLAEAAADEDAARDGRIVVVSDLQEGADLDAVAAAAWPSGIVVELRPVEASGSTNATLTAAPTSDPGSPLVRVSNDPASERQDFTLAVGERMLPALVAPGESRVIAIPPDSAEVVLEGDDQSFDNRLFLAPREAARLSLGFVGDGSPDDPDGPEYYFRRAFGRSDLLEPSFVDPLAGEDASIVAVARALEDDELAIVRERLEGGAGVLLVLTSADMAGTLGQLAGAGATPELGESAGDYALLEDIDFDHPALREFRDPRLRDFTAVHFWRHRTLPPDALPGAKVLAAFDDGSPAWLEVPVGRGRLFVMASGWHPQDSQLALSSKFVPLLYSILSAGEAAVGDSPGTLVGQPLPLFEDDRRVILPDGTERALDGAPVIAGEPGLFQIVGERASRRVAVNLPRSESALRPLAPAALEAVGVPLSAEARSAPEGDGTRRLRDREAEANQNLWRWAALGLLGLLLVESVVASRSGAREAAWEGAPS